VLRRTLRILESAILAFIITLFLAIIALLLGADLTGMISVILGFIAGFVASLFRERRAKK